MTKPSLSRPQSSAQNPRQTSITECFRSRRVFTHISPAPRGGATAFRQWGQDFLFISFTACSPNSSGGNNIVLPPQPHLSGGKLPPLPYGGAAHACTSHHITMPMFSACRQLASDWERRRQFLSGRDNTWRPAGTSSALTAAVLGVVRWCWCRPVIRHRSPLTPVAGPAVGPSGGR